MTQNLDPKSKKQLDSFEQRYYFFFMPLSSTERGKRFKAKMYAAGYKQKQIWVPRIAVKNVQLDRQAFIRWLDGVTSELRKEEQAALYTDLIKFIKKRKGNNL